ncbi:hypothetical protein Hanom_Chr17g01577091 [Helianthus anomalus]
MPLRVFRPSLENMHRPIYPCKGTRGGSLVIEFITHKHQSSFAMSLTIFPSLTTIFSGGGHHSPPHPTIPPNQ